MHGHPIRRGLIAAAVYLSTFVGLILIQFSRQTVFSLSLGSLAVSGKYSSSSPLAEAVAEPELPTGAKTVSGNISVFFKGTEFRFSGAEGLSGRTASEQLVDSALAILESTEGLKIFLESGSSITFATKFVDGAEILTLQARLANGQTELHLPYRPMRQAKMVELTDGRLAINFNNDNYAFTPSDSDDRLLIFRDRSSHITLAKVLPQKPFSPLDLISALVLDNTKYAQALAAWRQAAFISWERAMAGNPDEELVIAYLAESLARNNYRSAVATTPASFLNSTNRSYLSAPYFGSLDQAQKSLLAAERETLSRISRLANERDLDLFNERDLLPFLNIRASKTLNDVIDAFARSIDPSLLSLRTAAGILEAYADWRGEATINNPYSHLLNQARFVIGESLRRSPTGLVLPVTNDRTDTYTALRWGRALEKSALADGETAWANLGRTILWSLLQLADQNGSWPADFIFPADGEPRAASGAARIDGSRFYAQLVASKHLPRAIALATDSTSTPWLWSCTAMATLESTDKLLDITIKFDVGETHYVIVRGVRPFVKLQLYGIDYRTDPRFERYDSSGWVYSAADRLLLVKMKHKTELEHIKIFY